MKPNETIKEIAENWAWEVAFRIRRGVLKRYYSPPDSGTWLIGVFSGLEPNDELSVAVARLAYQQTDKFEGAGSCDIDIHDRSAEGLHMD